MDAQSSEKIEVSDEAEEVKFVKAACGNVSTAGEGASTYGGRVGGRLSSSEGEVGCLEFLRGNDGERLAEHKVARGVVCEDVGRGRRERVVDGGGVVDALSVVVSSRDLSDLVCRAASVSS